MRFLRLAAALLCLLPGVALAQDALAPVNTTAVANAVPRRQVASILYGNASFLTSGWTIGGTLTAFLAIPLERRPVAVRFALANVTTNTYSVNGITFNTSSTVADYVNPTGGGSWAYSTFANAGADSEYPRVAGTAPASFTVPANTPDPVTNADTASGAAAAAARVPSIAWSDWNYISPVEPASGKLYWLFARMLLPAGTSYGVTQINPDAVSGYTGGAWTGNAAINAGRDFALKIKGGGFDGVTSPNTAVSGLGTTTLSPFYIVQVMYDAPAVTIVSGGDSHFAGDKTAGGFASLATRAAALLTDQTGVPVQSVNVGWGGSSSNTFWPTLHRTIDATRPGLVVLQGWTANDGISTQAGADKYWARIVHVAAKVQAYGGKAVFVTGYPRDASFMAGTGVLAQWQYLRTKLLAAQASGQLIVFDSAPLVGSITTGTWNAGMSDDNVHPNNAATTTLLPGLVNTVAPYIRGR